MHRLSVVTAPLGALLLLTLLGPAPGAAITTVRTASSAPDPQPVLVAALDLVAWALVTWLVVVLLVVAAGRLPGLLGRAFSIAAYGIAPASVRRLAQLTLGLGATAVLLTAESAWAAPNQRAPLPPASAPSYDWPTGPPADLPPGVARPLPAAVPAATRVVVRPGDTLWAIAQAHLGAAAPPAAVARSWPRWWAANRSGVGQDPDLIHPGLVLTPPPEA